jgi:hypothetical protein
VKTEFLTGKGICVSSFGQMEYSEFMAIVPPPPNEETVSEEYAKECPANETLSPSGDPYSPKCTDRPGPKPLSLVATNPECVCLEVSNNK